VLKEVMLGPTGVKVVLAALLAEPRLFDTVQEKV